MLLVIIPVLMSFFVGPGVGQLYNKEFKKGFGMIIFSMGLLLIFSVWISRAALPYMPADIQGIDRNTLLTIKEHITKDHPGTYYTYEFLLAAIWIYGVVDALIGGLKRRNARTAAPAAQS